MALPSPMNGGSGFIQVFFDRLEEISQDRKGEAPLGLILGLTIAHETGHLMLPGKQHSLSGIMQGCVGLRNLRLAARGWMSFTVEQRRAIGANVRKWSNLSESNAVYAKLLPAGRRWQNSSTSCDRLQLWNPLLPDRGEASSGPNE